MNRVRGRPDPAGRPGYEHLFTGGRTYDEFKDEYDALRLTGNTVFGWLRAHLFPNHDS